MRIFHGLFNIAGIPSVLARAERALGVESTAVCFPADNPGYVPDIYEPLRFQPSDDLLRFNRHVRRYDVFVFNITHSLTREPLADVPLLKDMGKTVIFYFHGCDIRQSKETIKKYRFSSCRECWPHRCNPNRDLALEVATRYADAIWVSTPDLLEFVPGATLFPQPFDVRSVVFRPERDARAEQHGPIRIAHAPSDRMLKGTRYLLAAVERLRLAGLPVELDLIENISREKALERYRQADIAVEQLLAGSYGTFAVELMAIGVPVICYIRNDLVGKYPQPPPIAIADPLTIDAVLQDLLARPSDWPAIARRGRAYVEQFHEARLLAQQAITTYRTLRQARNGPLVSAPLTAPQTSEARVGDAA